ncbi:hypothetical protein [Modestobacter sp. URMC 112]
MRLGMGLWSVAASVGLIDQSAEDRLLLRPTRAACGLTSGDAYDGTVAESQISLYMDC